MHIRHALIAALLVAVLPQVSLASGKLTHSQASAKRALATYGFKQVDVTRLNPSQLAQIHYLANSDSGTGRIRGQLGAILRQSHIWDLSRK